MSANWSIKYPLVVLLLTALAGCNTFDSRPDQTSDAQTHSAVDDAFDESFTEDDSSFSASHDPDYADTTGDLWVRMRDGFALNHVENEAVVNERKWMLAHPEYLKRIRRRASPYLYYILDEIEQRQLPTELALLPVVESAYNPFAYSAGQAAGLWQFIPSTGMYFGLKQDWWYDGRRDVRMSTRAALDYLQRLHGRFDDWELALAGYNAGGGTVSRAIGKAKQKGLPTDYWSIELRDETRKYVPRLLAISQIIADPDKYGVKLKPLPDEPYFEAVDTGGQIDIALAAELAGITTDEMYLLNPAYNRWATDPNGPFDLLVPVDKADAFQAALAQLPGDARMKWSRYQIRPGDNLLAIAKQHKTSADAIRTANDLTGNSIRAGDYLLIPVASKDASHYALSESQRHAATQRSGKGQKTLYHVARGDSLWKISRAHGVDHEALARWNGMSPKDPLKIGQALVIWNASVSPVQTVAQQSDSGERITQVNYRVRHGDSLYKIAGKFNVGVKDVQRWNSLQSNMLKPGQKLTLFVDVTRQAM